MSAVVVPEYVTNSLVSVFSSNANYYEALLVVSEYLRVLRQVAPITPDGTCLWCQVCIAVLERFEKNNITEQLVGKLQQFQEQAYRNACVQRAKDMC